MKCFFFPPANRRNTSNYYFLDGATNASLKPGQALVSVFITVSKKVQDYEVYDVHFDLFVLMN